MRDEHGYTIGRVDEIQGTRGWFFGSFMKDKGYPNLNAEGVEAAVMTLPLEDQSRPHYHLIGTEVTYVFTGRLTLHLASAQSPDQVETINVGPGEFFVVKPGTILQNPINDPGTTIVVLKFPSVPADKYYYEGLWK